MTTPLSNTSLYVSSMHGIDDNFFTGFVPVDLKGFVFAGSGGRFLRKPIIS